jgi:hypothetical protein
MKEENKIPEMEKHLPYKVFNMLGQYMSQRTEIDVACSLVITENTTPDCTDTVIRANKQNAN